MSKGQPWPMLAADAAVLSLYSFTILFYGFVARFDLLVNVAIPSPRFLLIGSSYFEVVALDLLGLFVLYHYGAIRSLAFVVLTGAAQLSTWGLAYTALRPAFTAAQLADPRILLITAVYLAAVPVLALALRGRVDWRPNAMMVPFAAYWALYFGPLGAPYVAGSPANTPWEVAYEGLLDLAMLSGLLKFGRLAP